MEQDVALNSIYIGDPDTIYSFLYQLLAEREPYEAISHTNMPTFQQHEAFIERKPYKLWFVIMAKKPKEDMHTMVGSIYLSFQNEIGISIAKKHRRKGYAKAAIKKLIEISQEKFFLANINHLNVKSSNMFENMGFSLLQETYKLERKDNAVS